MPEHAAIHWAASPEQRIRIDLVDGDEWSRLRERPGSGLTDADRATLQRLATFARFDARPGSYVAL